MKVAIECGKLIGQASTGPRPRGRGMAAITSITQQIAIGSFNGAAPARARNGNGAWRTLILPHALQRGRARAGAE